jgi:hypothetical protein
VAVCRDAGDYITNGFGHLNGAAAEIVVEEIRDVELAKASTNASTRNAVVSRQTSPSCAKRQHCREQL